MRSDGGWRNLGRGIVVAVCLASAWRGGDAAQAAPPAEFHVAPDGDDTADGRQGRPVKTLRRALDLVRELRKRRASLTPITVEVADGRYELADTLLITAEDSGAEKSPTIIHAAEDADPVFSGGRRITGWTVTEVDGRPRWSAVLPEVKGGRWRFTQLFVDGQRRFRPALPANGWFTVRASLPPSPAAEGRGHDRFAAAAEDVLREWSQRDAIEVVAVHQWSMSRMRIAAIEAGEEAGTANVQLVGTTSSVDPWGAFAAGARYRLENVREALGSPGSWYLDVPTGTLTYCPLDGEDPDSTEVVAPRVDTLLSVRGEPVPGGTVDHLRFVGLSFTHGNWPMPSRGQSAPQGDLNVGAAVSLTGARDVQLIRCGIRHVGRYGLALGVGCGRCLIDRCELLDLGAGGVMVGTTAAGGRSIARVTENTIRDSTIAHGGRLHPAGIGIWIGMADRTTVERCEIADFTYTGVSVGWTWGYEPSPAERNRIAANHIHHLGRGVLSDMGGVYTLGVSPGTIVEGNRIHDIVSHDYGGWGLYTDEGSSGIVMRDNVVHRASSGSFHQHYGKDNLIENNILASARDWQLQRTRVEEHVSFRFQRNIVWWDSDTPLAKGDWNDGIVARDNCYWHEGGKVTFPDGATLGARQKAKLESGSIVADPRFADPHGGDFTLPADSPVWDLGFKPIEAEAVGRKTPRVVSPDLLSVPTPWPEALVLAAEEGAAAGAEPVMTGADDEAEAR
jgi:hypothetical protein